MAEQGEKIVVGITAGADLSSSQYRVISIAGTLATEADVALGVLQNKPQQNEHASVAILGKMKGVAGGAIAAQARLTVASGGFLVTVSSGDGTIVGKNGNSAVSSGATFTFYGNFINADTNYDRQ